MKAFYETRRGVFATFNEQSALFISLVRWTILASIVGILVGTYSSIYIASAAALALDVSPVDLIPPKREAIDDLP